MARVNRTATAPIRIRRQRLGQWAGYVGGVGLLIAVIALVWGGGVNAIALGGIGLALLGFAAWAALDRADFLNFITGRQVRYGAAASFSALLLIGIVALTYGLVQRAALTLDMTQAQRFTLSPETLRTLERLETPLQITGFYSPAALTLREVDDQILRLYETATNGLIRRVYIDPEEQPALAAAFNVTADGQLFLSAVDADGAIIDGTTARIPTAAALEREVTNAISRQLVAGSIVVYFEISLQGRNPLDTGAEGLSGINAGIQESGLITQPLNLIEIADTGGDIPANAAAVIFPRPLRDLRPVEIGVIDRYLQRGGALLLLADATFNADPFLREGGAFNTYLWDTYAIRARDAVVVDPAVSGDTALDVISAVVFTENPIGARIDPVGDTRTLFRISRAVEADLQRPLANAAAGNVIVSSAVSYGETDFAALAATNTYTFDPAADLAGPLATVVWATNLDTDARIVLVGDSDFVTNGQVLAGGNGVLFTDALSWLTGLNERITFAPQAFPTGLPLIFVDAQTINLIALLVIVGLPGGVLVTGLIVWLRRSRRAEG